MHSSVWAEHHEGRDKLAQVNLKNARTALFYKPPRKPLMNFIAADLKFFDALLKLRNDIKKRHIQ